MENEETVTVEVHRYEKGGQWAPVRVGLPPDPDRVQPVLEALPGGFHYKVVEVRVKDLAQWVQRLQQGGLADVDG
jgi:hypothetical protein